MVGNGAQIMPERKTWRSQNGNARPETDPLCFQGCGLGGWLAPASFRALPADLVGLEETGTGPLPLLIRVSGCLPPARTVLPQRRPGTSTSTSPGVRDQASSHPLLLLSLPRELGTSPGARRWPEALDGAGLILCPEFGPVAFNPRETGLVEGEGGEGPRVGRSSRSRRWRQVGPAEGGPADAPGSEERARPVWPCHTSQLWAGNE